MTHVGRAILTFRKRLGLTQSELARRLGTGQGTVSKWERGKEAPRFESLETIADVLGVSNADLFDAGARDMLGIAKPAGAQVGVVGAAETGAWRDSSEVSHFSEPMIRLPYNEALEGVRLFGLFINDDSMNEVYPLGSFVFAAYLDRNSAPVHHDYVVATRHDEEGMQETIVRQYQVHADGTEWLWPRSTAPQYRKPSSTEQTDPSIMLTISGVVVASTRFEDVAHPERFFRD